MREHVLHAVVVMAENANADEQTIVDRLVDSGCTPLDAELLISFVPLGLARAVIQRLDVRPPIRLSETALIRHYAHQQMLEVRLALVPEFETALQLGRKCDFSDDDISPEQLTAASNLSVELNLINQALNAGKNIGGGSMAAPILLRVGNAPGFDEWYLNLNH